MLTSCVGNPPPDGATLFTYADPEGNTFACATCHALTETENDEFRRAGHPLADATKRPTYKNGQLTDMLDAVNSCREEWMAAPAWSEDSREWQALHGWLDAQAPAETATPLQYTILDTAPTDLSGAADTGRATFNATCASCHAPDAVGTNLAPPLRGEFLSAQGGADLIVRRVRTSGAADSDVYTGLTGGRMPFWSVERLTDQELADIVAFLLDHNPEPIDNDDNDGGNTVAGLDQPGNCGSTHSKVGWATTLSTKAHGVKGKATVHNDCTIRFDEFYYDASGIDVRVYGGVGGNYTGGFPMSPDLLRSTPYENVTMYIQVPAGKTLDDFDGVSIWCVDVAVDFGSGIFAPP